jgi:hypothetical protein
MRDEHPSLILAANFAGLVPSFGDALQLVLYVVRKKGLEEFMDWRGHSDSEERIRRVVIEATGGQHFLNARTASFLPHFVVHVLRHRPFVPETLHELLVLQWRYLEFRKRRALF